MPLRPVRPVRGQLTFSMLAATWSRRLSRPARSTSRPTTLISNSAVLPPGGVNHVKVLNRLRLVSGSR